MAGADRGHQEHDDQLAPAGGRDDQIPKAIGRREFLIKAGQFVVVAEVVSLVPFLSACDSGSGCTSATGGDDSSTCQGGCIDDVLADPACDSCPMGTTGSDSCADSCNADCTFDCTGPCTTDCTDGCTTSCVDDCTEYCQSDCTGDTSDGCGGGICAQCQVCLDGCQNVATGAW